MIPVPSDSSSQPSKLARALQWYWQNCWTIQVCARTVWIILILGVTIRVIAQPTRGTVFPTYTYAAENWVAGEPLYTLDFSKPCFRYHPTVGAFFVPWIGLSNTVGGLLWRWIGVALLLSGMALWARRIFEGPTAQRSTWWYFLLVMPLALGSVNNAQANIHLIGCLLLALVAVDCGRWNWAAALVMVATILKLYPIAMGLLLCAVYPRQFAWRYGVMLVGASLMPFLMQSASYVAEQYRLWLEYLVKDNRQAGSMEEGTRELHFLIRVWFGTPPNWLYRSMQLAGAGAVALLCLHVARRGETTREILSTIFNLGCAWMIVLGPAVEAPTYAIFAPTAAACVILATNASRNRRIVMIMCYALMVFPIFVVGFPGGRQVHLWGTQPLGALMMSILLVEQILRREYVDAVPQEQPLAVVSKAA